MRVVMVSDLHITGLEDPVQARFVRWLDELVVDELVLLGDLFHHWWSFGGAIQRGYVPVCAALLRLRARGVRLSVVPGNHDFRLGPFFTDDLGANVRCAHLRTLDQRRLFLGHGDEADGTAGYRFTRALLRSGLFAALMAVLGPTLGESLLRRLAGVSRDHPMGSARLLQAQRVWAAARVAEGAEVVVLGHSHAPGEEKIGEGRLIRLGDWSRGRVWLEVEDGQTRLIQDEG